VVKGGILTFSELWAQRYAGLALEQSLSGGKPVPRRHLPHHLLVLVDLCEHLLLSRGHPSRDSLDAPLRLLLNGGNQ